MHRVCPYNMFVGLLATIVQMFGIGADLPADRGASPCIYPQIQVVEARNGRYNSSHQHTLQGKSLNVTSLAA